MLPRMSLSDYIAKWGDEAASKRLGITARAARAYRTKTRRPRPDVANRIIKRSRGDLTLESIYG